MIESEERGKENVAKNGLQLSFEIDDVMNYAIQQHGAEIVEDTDQLEAKPFL